MKKQLHPGAKWLFRLRAYFSLIFIGLFFIIWVGTLIAAIIAPTASSVLGAIVLLIVLYIIFVVIIGEIYARMSYNRWFYEFTDTNLKVEKGIIWKRYSNVPYERVQNVDIQRGIIARMLGFSSVNIQTAGYSMPAGGGYGMQSEGYIPAVPTDEAEKIRDFLMKKITKNSGRTSQGL